MTTREKPRTAAIVGGLFLGVFIGSAGERLKALTIDPPVIEEIVFEVSYPAVVQPVPSDFYFARYQTNAVLISKCSTKELAMKARIDDKMADAIARYDRYHWKLSSDQRHMVEWDDLGDPVEQDNRIVRSFSPRVYWLQKVMNLGAGRVPIGDLPWRGNGFSHTNRAGHVSIGEFGPDTNGKLTGMKLELQIQVPSREKPVRGAWLVDYRYGGRHGVIWFPDQLSTRVRNPDGSYRQADLITIHRLKFAKAPLPASAFHWDSYTAAKPGRFFRVKGDSLSYTTASGRERTVGK